MKLKGINDYSWIILRTKGWSGSLSGRWLDEIFTSGLEVCCISGLFPIPPTTFICSVYNTLHIFVSSQLRIKLFVNSILIRGHIQVVSLNWTSACMICFQSHGLVVDSVLQCCDLAQKTSAEIWSISWLHHRFQTKIVHRTIGRERDCCRSKTFIGIL